MEALLVAAIVVVVGNLIGLSVVVARHAVHIENINKALGREGIL